MHVRRSKRRLAIVIALATLAQAQTQAAEIAVSANSPLGFGTFAAGNGGTVSVSTSGSCSAAGDVIIINPDCTRAEFLVTGDPHFTYTIELPADNTVALTGPGSNMVINSFVSNPAAGANGLLSASGSQVLSVGGVLSVGANQTAGSYSGTFSVIVQYN